jgi:hypothetical protein
MSNPNATSPRPTLKLKLGARRSPREPRTAAVTQSINAGKSKPGAQWSDEHKPRMQAEMDALASRYRIVTHPSARRVIDRVRDRSGDAQMPSSPRPRTVSAIKVRPAALSIRRIRAPPVATSTATSTKCAPKLVSRYLFCRSPNSIASSAVMPLAPAASGRVKLRLPWRIRPTSNSNTASVGLRPKGHREIRVRVDGQ